MAVRWVTCRNGSIECLNRLFAASQIFTNVGPLAFAVISRNRREIPAGEGTKSDGLNGFGVMGLPAAGAFQTLWRLFDQKVFRHITDVFSERNGSFVKGKR